MGENMNILTDLIQCASTSLECLDPEDTDDVKIIIGLLECCESAWKLPPKKRTWMKASREEREYDNFSFTTEMEGLNIDRNKAELLLSLVRNDLTRKNTVMRGAIPAAVRLAGILRSIITGESYRSTDMHTQLSQSFICRETPIVCQAIWKNLKDTYLKFPTTRTEWKNIAEGFEEKWQFPNCLGALGANHINFRGRRSESPSGGKVLLTLVDANFKFIYIDISDSKSMDDAAAFEASSLKRVLEDRNQTWPQDVILGNGITLPPVILGDNEFPLKTYLMKPFRNDTDITNEKLIFNKRLYQARKVVDHAFALLFQRFKAFQTVLNLRVENIETVTIACCVLHNFLLENDESYQPCFAYIRNEAETVKFNSRIESEEALRVREEFMAYFVEDETEEWNVDD